MVRKGREGAVPMKSGMFDVSGYTVLITGSSRGIGLAFARGFLKAGAVVVLNDIDETRLASAVSGLEHEGYRVSGYPFDITDEAQVEKAVASIEQEVGPIDVLINNAGIQKRGPLEDFSLSDWKLVMDVDLTGPFLTGKAVARRMIGRRKGKIIHITSINAELARRNIGPYCTAKGGLKMLTRSMAAEWGRYNIHVNAIGPGYMLTELTASLAEDPEFDAWVKSEVPLNRWGRTEDLIGCAIFLSSRASDYLSGQTIYIDGGWQASL